MSNPLISDAFDTGSRRYSSVIVADRMTVAGVTAKTGFFLGLLMAAAAFGWTAAANIDSVGFVALVAVVVAFGFAMLIVRDPGRARAFGPAYALAEGLAVGIVSQWYASKPIFENKVPGTGIVIAAFALTAAIAAALLAVCAAGKLRISVGSRFFHGIVAATGGVALFYMISLFGSLVGFEVPLLWDNSNAGIVFSAVVVVLAAANLVIDFSYVYESVGRADKEHEWYAAFSIMVSLVWLYLEILRLLAKAQSRK